MRSTSSLTRTLRSDSKGRVCIGNMAPNGITSFRAHIDKNHRIILEPLVEVAVRTLLEKVKSDSSRTKEKSFAKTPNKKLKKSFRDFEKGNKISVYKDVDLLLKDLKK